MIKNLSQDTEYLIQRMKMLASIFKSITAGLALPLSIKYGIVWLFVLLPLIVVFVERNPFSLHSWYYFLLVPIIMNRLTASLRSDASYLSGVAAAVAVTFLVYRLLFWYFPSWDIAFVVGHMYSLPGLLLGAWAFSYLKVQGVKDSLLAFLFGFSGAIIGFILNQLYLCNTDIWCGCLSFGK
ncbi:MAG TPA: hypothetical protein PK425_00510 [Syntrophales bacterium]|jgi:hypothetical protein|nr:hypothetical protein [Syntrophales bacterium]HPX54989.1 hypothetical protein [Syntrophales bacterium]